MLLAVIPKFVNPEDIIKYIAFRRALNRLWVIHVLQIIRAFVAVFVHAW